MRTYRTRRRVLKFALGTKLVVPATAQVIFILEPAQAFGVTASGGRTAVRAVAASLEFNVRTGQYFVTSAEPLTPLELAFGDGTKKVTVQGNELRLELIVNSEAELNEVIELVYYGLPILLGPRYADPPLISDVRGTVNGHEFGWNLSTFRPEILTTTQEAQCDKLRAAWDGLHALGKEENRRLVAALHYFHVAARLERVSAMPGEFLAEALLNYAKVLEALFGPSTDDMREALRHLGFQNDAIERDFIPAVIMRSKFDVAHVSLVHLDDEQLAVLQRFAERAESQLRRLLEVILSLWSAGSLVLPPYPAHGADKDTATILTRLSTALDGLGDRP